MHHVIIIGSGPAGLTAAIYAARATMAPLVIEGPQPGGQLMMTTEVENFPGFAKGIMGPVLMMDVKAQAQHFGATFIPGSVEKVDFSGETKKVWVQGKMYEAKVIIVATGASSRWLGLPREKELVGHGVSTCATCDGAFFRNKRVAVIGGGDSAMEEAMFLTKFATSVTIVHRREAFKASKIMLDRAKNNPKITFLTNKESIEYIGEKKIEGLKIKDVQTQEEQVLPVEGVFMAIGHVPNTSFLQGHIELDEKGYVIYKHRTMTSVEGVFVCGDVQDHVYRQAITAAGEGAKAAIDAERYLIEQGL